MIKTNFVLLITRSIQKHFNIDINEKLIIFHGDHYINFCIEDLDMDEAESFLTGIKSELRINVSATISTDFFRVEAYHRYYFVNGTKHFDSIIIKKVHCSFNITLDGVPFDLYYDDTNNKTAVEQLTELLY